MRVFLLLLLVAPALDAAWERVVMTGKGEFVDKPGAHSLSYFTQYPGLRDVDGYLCIGCSPEQTLAAAKAQKARTEVKLVGTIRRFTIYDVFYFFDDEPEPQWKSILVRTGPDQYREIWHYQKIQGGIWPSFLVNAGNQTLLGLDDHCYRLVRIQEYFRITESGVTRIDFSPISEAANSILPDDTSVWFEFDGRTDLPRGRIRVPLFNQGDDRCCTEGVVDVWFTLVRSEVVVKRTRFVPKASFPWALRCR
jgi:hypothetical protein